MDNFNSKLCKTKIMLDFSNLNTIGTLLTGIGTVILAIIIFFQNLSMQHQIKLAYMPSIVPRYTINQADPNFTSYLMISNAGQGSAIDVKLTITNLRTNQPISFNVYALMPTDERQTPVQLLANSLWEISGSYLDVRGKKHKLYIEFEYPPKIIKFKQ